MYVNLAHFKSNDVYSYHFMATEHQVFVYFPQFNTVNAKCINARILKET